MPLQATGYDLATGKPWTGEHQEWLAPWLRNATEDMRVLVRAYRRERSHRSPASGMVQLGEILRGLADPAAKRRRIVSATMETGRHRGRGTDRNDQLLSLFRCSS